VHRQGVNSRLFVHPKITIKSALLSSLIGAYLHVILDSVMRKEIVPLYPFFEGNVFHGLTDVGVLYLFCIILGVIGLLFWGTAFMSEK
jgi:membrane-bound metal-dependent hydrolase YbcI (DUF457 family)